MTAQQDEFEARAREALDESVTRVNGRVRSRLNQARQAALAEIGARPRSIWQLPALLPAAGATAAAVLVALAFIANRGPERGFAQEGAAFEDIEMLSDRDGLELVENWDGSFYEWAVAAGEDGGSGA